MRSKRGWTVYIVRCKDNSLYTGITNNLDDRIRNHNEGKGAKSIVPSKRPVKLVWKRTHQTHSSALKLEYAIKHLGKVNKEALVNKKFRF